MENDMGNSARAHVELRGPDGPESSPQSGCQREAVGEEDDGWERAQRKFDDRSGDAPDDRNEQEQEIGGIAMIHGQVLIVIPAKAGIQSYAFVFNFCITLSIVNSSCVFAFISFNFTTPRDISSGP